MGVKAFVIFSLVLIIDGGEEELDVSLEFLPMGVEAQEL